jgi:general secretion pathway protein C
MMRLLSRHFGLIKFAGVGLVVFFAGSALTTHFTSKLLLDVSSVAQAATETDEDPFTGDEDDDDPMLARGSATKLNDRGLAGMAGKSTRKQQSADGIVGANIFCPTCSPAVAEELSDPLLASAGPMQFGETASSLPLKLLATMESDDPTWSMATIQDIENHRVGPFTANEQVRPGVTILAVERGRVVLLNQGRREFISLGNEPPKPSAVPKPAAAQLENEPATKPGSAIAIDGADKAISCASENTCTVDRAFVEKLMANPNQLMTQARMFPVTKDGETQGFRVSGIRNGSLATMIGLKNGDVVSEINGAKLGTIDDALAMYQKLRRANHLSVTVERGGAVINKEISIK